MPDHDPFLTALAERPGDDTLRLVYADWLDENGLPDHAAFLRLEVRLQRAEREPGWFALCRAFLRAAKATPDDWRELVSRPRLIGTWRHEDWDHGTDQEVEFLPGGRLQYRLAYRTAREGDESNEGTWRRFGPRVTLVINSYSAHCGTIRGDSLPLRGRTVIPEPSPVYWVWTLTRVPSPDCFPDTG